MTGPELTAKILSLRSEMNTGEEEDWLPGVVDALLIDALNGTDEKRRREDLAILIQMIEEMGEERL